jgi:hypothetical protein
LARFFRSAFRFFRLAFAVRCDAVKIAVSSDASAIKGSTKSNDRRRELFGTIAQLLLVHAFNH